ncbi:MAG: UDP-N-acetylmuramoyl-L-alanyl-D-glutamate--2,6-diaminopimelate ligase [Alphaproteobacteria bacterium]|nr:UDP-N-acetylmuramoyl-L-alanyl-D-glutamate--2,6-diaminopimelate ligase [Alphaproteobacteria bacterium]MDE2629558.1 UDP-N-acetylmuramoyl-L-alanyl-D-glutamate--2,6-diaminopimelate ligase [Alphaproteobacteria bacterium]
MGPHSGAKIVVGKAGKNPMEASENFAGLASDSREVRPGYLFAALPGTKANGAEFVKDAVKRGAVAVLGRPDVAPSAAALGVRFIADENPRKALARFAARFFADQPSTVAAVTGTNGKTSVSVFLREIWTALGKPAASMGTIGVVTPSGATNLNHTTPGPIELHRILAGLKHDGIDRLAVEASSHGLDQFRLDGVDIAAVGFTNITRDHMDYHPTFEAYLACKLRLFDELARDGAAAVVNADTDHAQDFIAAAKVHGLKLLTVGEKGDAVRLLARTPRAGGQSLHIAHGGENYAVDLPLPGAFQASNALMAAAYAIGLGEDARAVFAALANLKGAPGRLEKVAVAKSGAPVYVDYAHTPDALENVLSAVRPHTKGHLVVVFGCGGNRDKGKRPLMGAVAAKFADRVIVTDDNPRSEDAAAIRAEALAGCPGAREIADRAAAIRAGIEMLAESDVLVIAGKGHESGQTVGAVVHPFSDREEAVKAAVSLGGRHAEYRA